MRWHEFQFTFFDFPGQTLYHDGLLVEHEGPGLFFTGDSFTPSGIDDYCLQNRDFMREGEGYLYCLNLLQRLPRNIWLVNQHVDPVFRFSPEQFTRMRAELLKRTALLKGLAPWPDPNFAIDESWAAVDPYGSEARQGENLVLRVRILNHAPRRETYRVKWNVTRRLEGGGGGPGSDDPGAPGRRGAGSIQGREFGTPRGHRRHRIRRAQVAGVDRGAGTRSRVRSLQRSPSRCPDRWFALTRSASAPVEWIWGRLLRESAPHWRPEYSLPERQKPACW